MNVWHSTEQRTIDATIDHWCAQLKARGIRAEGGHFEHML